jgi:hypothetical protein
MGVTGAIGGMKIGRGNRSTRRKPAPGPLCPPQIPHGQTRARTQAAAVGSQRLTAWAMARPRAQSYSRYSAEMHPTSDWMTSLSFRTVCSFYEKLSLSNNPTEISSTGLSLAQLVAWIIFPRKACGIESTILSLRISRGNKSMSLLIRGLAPSCRTGLYLLKCHISIATEHFIPKRLK